MITINLLPKNFRKKDISLDLPFTAIAVKVVVWILAVTILLGVVGLYKRTRATFLNNKWESMAEEFAEVSQIKKDLNVKKASANTMEYVLKKDVYWTDLLSKINSAIPKGLWISRLNLNQNGLLIDGSVFSFSADEVTLINKFFNKLKEDEFFKVNFSNFSLDSVQRRTIKQYEIFDFLLTAERNEERFEITWQ